MSADETLSSIRRLRSSSNRRARSSGDEVMARVRDLQTRIDRQEERLIRIEAELALMHADEDAAGELAQSLDRIEHATREALRNFYDPGRLANGDLAMLLADLDGRTLTSAELQALLRNAIGLLKPAEEISSLSHSYCCYDILTLTYLEGQSVPEIMSRLAISRRQYYRELKIAVRAVAYYLFSVYPATQARKSWRFSGTKPIDYR